MNGEGAEVDRLTQEVATEIVGRKMDSSGEVVRTVITEAMSPEAGLLKNKITEYSPLDCGHVVKSATEVTVCSCNQKICCECAKENGVCQYCNRSLCRRCRVESMLSSKIFYCKRCRWWGWIKRIF